MRRFLRRLGNSIQKRIDMLPWRRNRDEDKGTSEFPEGTSEFPEGTRWIYGDDISSWPKTIKLEGASISRQGGPNNYHTVSLHNDALKGFPAWYQNPDPDNYNQHNVNGTIWILRKYKGEWLMGSIDYLRVGQISKGFAVVPQYQIESQPGEPVGVMVSTTSRQWDGTRVDGDPNSPYRFRSNVVWTTWP